MLSVTLRAFAQTYAQPLKFNAWLLGIVGLLAIVGLIEVVSQTGLPLREALGAWFLLVVGLLINGCMALVEGVRKCFRRAAVYVVAALLLFMVLSWVSQQVGMMTVGW
jgi:hypothetical protein